MHGSCSQPRCTGRLHAVGIVCPAGHSCLRPGRNRVAGCSSLGCCTLWPPGSRARSSAARAGRAHPPPSQSRQPSGNSPAASTAGHHACNSDGLAVHARLHWKPSQHVFVYSQGLCRSDPPICTSAIDTGCRICRTRRQTLGDDSPCSRSPARCKSGISGTSCVRPSPAARRRAGRAPATRGCRSVATGGIQHSQRKHRRRSVQVAFSSATAQV
mmetsp:Transcript_67354/g.170895  ORF Transcript_67354/g.170895 Transcript_67354/m.170895 type:complete len:214 (-) Transcript_67354:1039-1680(-)